ncbi:MAG: oligosaccharide flippase family protein [Campylobacteraceae bacterium]|nr:oligosaccharide flippase family protein [Campylobacteraceae bacterium]
MLNKLKPKSEFGKNVLTLMSGTALAQAIPIAISPMLTRLYSPEDFGTFAIFSSLVAVLLVFSNGRYELAIVLPKKDTDALSLLALCIFINLCLSIFILFLVLIFGDYICGLLSINKNISKWLYLLPIFIFCSGLYQSLNYWLNRKKYYKNLATSRVVQNLTSSGLNLSFGYINLGSKGLIFSQFLAQFISLLYVVIRSYKEIFNKKEYINKKCILINAKNYIKFPKYDIPATFINVFSNQLSNILFNIMLNATTAGFYYMAQKVIGLPTSIIATSIGDVFRQKAASDYKLYQNAKDIYIFTFVRLFTIGSFPFFVLFFFGDCIFSFVFGQKWMLSGEIVQIMSPMLFIRFVSSPLSFMLYIGNKQNINMITQFMFLIAIIISFAISDNMFTIVKSISILFFIIYLYYLYVSAKIAKVFD